MVMTRLSGKAFEFAVQRVQTESKRESFDKFLKLFDLIVARTPVDTGELRANIDIRYGLDSGRQYIFGSKNSVLPSPSANISFDPLATEPMVIALSAPYATEIEFGSWSNKAPSGMVGISVQEIYGV